MTALPWILVGVLAVVVVWLLFALSGASRTIASMRAGDPEDGAPAHRHLSSGLPAGTKAPSIQGLSHDLTGSRQLVTFVDPDCAACDALVPELIRAADERHVPPTVLVSRGALAEHPATWLDTGPRIQLLVEPDSAVTDAYEVDVTPTAFVIDEGGIIVAGGTAETIEEVLTLVQDVRGVRIAPGTEVDPEVIHGAS